MRPLIYDFGMHNGDDVAYYLATGASVIAVEANPVLCQQASGRFATEIGGGRVTILNVVLAAEASDAPLPFYVHRTNTVLSQLTTPDRGESDQFDRIAVPRRTASSIVQEHGTPHYIKIDIEGMDSVILRDLFAHGIQPAYLSAEAHTVEPFALMVAAGYTTFNLVDGATVSQVYRETDIAVYEGTAITVYGGGSDQPTATTRVRHSFPAHAAGPYGADLHTPWLSADAFLPVLAKAGLGWKDIHASKVRLAVDPDPQRAIWPELRTLLRLRLES